jgi:hypothetical protein
MKEANSQLTNDTETERPGLISQLEHVSLPVEEQFFTGLLSTGEYELLHIYSVEALHCSVYAASLPPCLYLSNALFRTACPALCVTADTSRSHHISAGGENCVSKTPQ